MNRILITFYITTHTLNPSQIWSRHKLYACNTQRYYGHGARQTEERKARKIQIFGHRAILKFYLYLLYVMLSIIFVMLHNF